MMLTAAKFYASPSNPNARLLFRASLLHLPIFMIAFLLHRRPNAGEDRASMLLAEFHKLGIGPGRRDADGELIEDEGREMQAGVSTFGRDIGRVSLPPLPFLPVPHFEAVVCPAKVACQERARPVEEGGKEAKGAA
jgi:protoheme IX farnesyltransferase